MRMHNMVGIIRNSAAFANRYSKQKYGSEQMRFETVKFCSNSLRDMPHKWSPRRTP